MHTGGEGRGGRGGPGRIKQTPCINFRKLVNKSSKNEWAFPLQNPTYWILLLNPPSGKRPPSRFLTLVHLAKKKRPQNGSSNGYLSRFFICCNNFKKPGCLKYNGRQLLKLKLKSAKKLNISLSFHLIEKVQESWESIFGWSSKSCCHYKMFVSNNIWTSNEIGFVQLDSIELEFTLSCWQKHLFVNSINNDNLRWVLSQYDITILTKN